MKDDYMTTEETANFLGVTRKAVEYWRKKGILMPDVIGHGKNQRGGVYYYSKERILQLAAVYVKQNENAKRNPNNKLETTNRELEKPEVETENWKQTGKTGNEQETTTGNQKRTGNGITSGNEPQTDKKNYATESVEKNIISANKSDEDFSTIADKKQSHIAELVHFFNQLYGKITDKNFSYLITFKDGIETYSFSIAEKTQRIEMAVKAIELSNKGFDVWHAVNPVCVEPTSSKRGDELAVSHQIAIVVDIDIQSDAHKSDNLAADFDEAKSFLPFTPSIIIHSGYGLHAYYIFNEPIKITNENREELKRRNNLLLDVIRAKANGKKIDGVGDLPRVLRTPGTFNYKLGKDNAPLCHIVEDSGLRFSPDQIDERLNALIISQETGKQETISSQNSVDCRKSNEEFVDDRDFNIFRARRMLDFISPSSLTYDDWLAVGMALKNIGCNCSDWEQWSHSDDRFKDGECLYKWNGFDRDGYDIGTLYHFATPNGYDAQDTFREYYNLHLNFKTSDKKQIDDEPNSMIDSLKAELRENSKALADFDAEKNAAIEHLKSVETFDSDSVFAEDLLTAAAFAKIFDKKAFSDFKSEITIFNRKTKEKKASVNEWSAVVRDKAADIFSRQNDLLTRHNEILAQIRSLSFVATNDELQNFSIPSGYSVSNNGLEKVAGESMITVCRNPVIIKSKTFSVDEKIFKLTLAYVNQAGKLKTLPPVIIIPCLTDNAIFTSRLLSIFF